MSNNGKRETNKFKAKPILKQFTELKQVDFEKYPVWVNCHGVDYNEPWYNETNEETFRPWTENIPVDPSHMMYLVKSSMILIDGTVYCGFITPIKENKRELIDNIGTIQPYIFHPSGKMICFWYGLREVKSEDIRSLYELLQKSPKEIFPIRFEIEHGLSLSFFSGEIFGLYYQEKSGNIKIVQ